MNIFFVDESPVEAAKCLHNTHVVKMLLESCQLLSNVNYHCGDDFSDWTRHVEHRDEPYAKTHFNHPCSIWARTSHENYLWLLEHAYTLSREYTFRYNKQHKCANVVGYFAFNISKINLPKLGLTTPALAMPDQYKKLSINSLGDVVESYRDYYVGDKWRDKNGNRIDRWSYRNPPSWWTTPESRGLV